MIEIQKKGGGEREREGERESGGKFVMKQNTNQYLYIYEAIHPCGFITFKQWVSYTIQICKIMLGEIHLNSYLENIHEQSVVEVC